jgi:hypothetical protein
MAKPLLNFNIPAGGGKLTSGRIIGTAVTVAAFYAVWNWGSKAPYVGKYINYGEGYILKALGFNVPTPTL